MNYKLYKQDFSCYITKTLGKTKKISARVLPPPCFYCQIDQEKNCNLISSTKTVNTSLLEDGSY